MKKQHIILAVAAVTALAVGVYFFASNSKENIPGKIINNISSTSKQSEPKYHSRFAPFNVPEEKINNTEVEDLPTDISPSESIQGEQAQKLFSTNGFVVTPTKFTNPFDIYTEENSDAHLITTDLVLATYISLFQKIKHDTFHKTLPAKISSFSKDILTTDSELHNELIDTFTVAALLMDEDISEIEYDSERIEKILATFKEDLPENMTPEEKVISWISKTSFEDLNSSQLTSFVQTLEKNPSLQMKFFEIYDIWTFFYGQETHPDIYDIFNETENATPNTEISFFPSINSFQSILSNTTSPETPMRENAKALDILASIGNSEALQALTDEGDMQVYPSLGETFSSLAIQDNLAKNDFSEHSLATQFLNIFSLKTASTQAFMKNNAYSNKKLNTLLAAQTLLLNNDTKNPQEEILRTFPEITTVLEENAPTYLHLSALSEQINKGLFSRTALSEENEKILNQAASLALELSENSSISNDTISSLEEIYVPEFGQKIISSIDTSGEVTQSAIGPAHKIHTFYNINREYIYASGFSFSHYAIKGDALLSSEEWETKITEDNLPSYSLWNKGFIGIE